MVDENTLICFQNIALPKYSCFTDNVCSKAFCLVTLDDRQNGISLNRDKNNGGPRLG